MKFVRSWLSWALILTMAFNPLFLETAAWAQDTTSTVTNTSQQVNEGDQKVQEVEEVDPGWFASAVMSVMHFFGGKDYNKEIKEANQAIRDAKAQSTDAKALTETSAGQHTAARVAGAGMKASIEATTKAKAVLQKALMETGKKLQEVAVLLDKVGKLLSTAGSALSGVPYVGAIMAVVAVAGKVIIGVAAVVKAAGAALIAAGQKGMQGDDIFVSAISAAGEAFVSGYAKGSSLVSSAASAVTSLTSATNGTASWIDKVKVGLETAGDIGKTASSYIDKGKSIITNVWNTGKKIWDGVSGWFSSGDTAKASSEPSTSIDSEDANVNTDSTSTDETISTSDNTENTGTDDTSTTPETSGEPDPSFMGGEGE